ncbi:hypothetical protein BDW62DRAFT_192052 [Aspergillus aurantiobrunneus]
MAILQHVHEFSDTGLEELVENGRTLLHKAAINGNLRAIEDLLEWGCAAGQPDNDYRTAPSYAAENRNPDAMRMLLERSVNLRLYRDYSVHLVDHCLSPERPTNPTPESIASMRVVLKEL